MSHFINLRFKRSGEKKKNLIFWVLSSIFFYCFEVQGKHIKSWSSSFFSSSLLPFQYKTIFLPWNPKRAVSISICFAFKYLKNPPHDFTFLTKKKKKENGIPWRNYIYICKHKSEYINIWWYYCSQNKDLRNTHLFDHLLNDVLEKVLEIHSKVQLQMDDLTTVHNQQLFQLLGLNVTQQKCLLVEVIFDCV